MIKLGGEGALLYTSGGRLARGVFAGATPVWPVGTDVPIASVGGGFTRLLSIAVFERADLAFASGEGGGSDLVCDLITAAPYSRFSNSAVSPVAVAAAGDRLFQLFLKDNNYVFDNELNWRPYDREVGYPATAVKLPQPPRAPLVVSPDGRFAACPTGAGSAVTGIMIIDTDTETVRTVRSDSELVESLALSPDGATLYAARGMGGVTVIDTATAAEVDIIWHVDGTGVGVAVSADGDRLFCTGGGLASAVDLITGLQTHITTTSVVSTRPRVHPDGSKLYLPDAFSARVLVYSTVDLSPLGAIALGSYIPSDIGFYAGGDWAAVSSYTAEPSEERSRVTLCYTGPEVVPLPRGVGARVSDIPTFAVVNNPRR